MSLAKTRPRNVSLPRFGAKWTAAKHRLVSLAAVLAFLVAWEVIGTSGWVNPIWTSSPSRVVTAAVQAIGEGGMLRNLLVSAQEFALGLTLATIVGILLGLLMGWYPYIDSAVEPFVTVLYVTPTVALVPLFIIWFGIGVSSKVAIVFFAGLFTILVNTYTGVKNLDPALVKVARCFKASDWQLFWTIALPGALPNIMAGFRLSVGRCLLAVVYGEVYASSAGIGYFIGMAGQRFQTDRVFFGVAIIAAAGLILNWLARVLEARLSKWRQTPGRK